jgi:hypothetical protein
MIRRLLLLWALMFWQGGFMFYGGVVVPVGSRVLGSDREQGFITRSVTNYLNLAGAVALAIWGLDILAEPGESHRGRRPRWLLWGLLILALGLLAWLHVRLDALLDPDESVILDRRRFGSLHSWYLTVSTVQWIGCVMLTALTVRAWRDGDAIDGGGTNRMTSTS